MTNARDNHIETLESHAQRLEGAPLYYQRRDNTVVRCDSCSGQIPKNGRISVWISDKDGRGESIDGQGGLALYRFHCMKCTPPPNYFERTMLSPVGWLEIVHTARVTPEKRLVDIEPYMASERSQGTPYVPQELLQEAVGLPDTKGLHIDGPQDAIDVLTYGTIDPREVLEGNITEARRRENAKKLANEYLRKGDPERVESWWEQFGDDIDESTTIVDEGKTADDTPDPDEDEGDDA